MGISQEQFQLMVESITSDLIQYLVEHQHYTLKDAIDTVYGSDLFASVSRPTTGLYNQSTGYLITYLMRELQNGKL